MTNSALLPKTENYVFGRGVIYVAIVDALGRPMGERDLGNTPGFTISVATTRFQHTSSRSGRATTDLDIPISTSMSGKITIEDMSAENLALFIAGTVSEITQSGSVTGELIYNAQAGYEYQLGQTTNNPTGVRGVSSVVVKASQLTGAAARANSTPYAVGDIFKSTTNVFIVTVAGTSAGSAPTFATTSVGATTTDGTATVAYLGTTAAFTVSTDYRLDTTLARIGILSTGALGLAADLYYEQTGNYLTLSVDYTKTSNSRTQIGSSGEGSITAQVRFIADNATGENRDLFIAECNLAPSGDNAFITSGNAIQSFTLDIGILERDSDTPQIIIDGRPV